MDSSRFKYRNDESDGVMMNSLMMELFSGFDEDNDKKEKYTTNIIAN